MKKSLEKLQKKIEIGSYEPIIMTRKEINKIKNRKIWWDVKTEDGGFLTENQVDAEILGRVIKIEQLLKKK